MDTRLARPRMTRFVITLGLGFALFAPAASAAGQGTPGNALNSGATQSGIARDPEGIGILDGSRSPSGFLTIVPTLKPDVITTSGGMRIRASVEFGAVGFDGNKQAAKFREYKDLPSGAYPNNFTLMLEQPANGFHLNAFGGGVTRNDQYYAVDVGRYNTWRVRGTFGETPHVFTSTYRSLWTGVGSSNLTLTTVPGLRAGGTTSAAVTQGLVQNAIGATTSSDLALTRQRNHVRFDLTLPASWKAFASYSQELRTGARPFGAVFGGGGGGGNMELPESIDYNSRDVAAGLLFANNATSLTVQGTASMFDNNISAMTFENPIFINTNTIAGVASTVFTRGQMPLAPSNSAFNVRAEFGQKLQGFMRSRFTALVAIGRSTQDDGLLPWSLEPLTGGTVNGVSTTGMWNTTAALSRTSADRRLDTRLLNASIVMNPSRDLSVRAKVRYYGTNNDSDYLACNPLTGQWGRLLNNGSGGSFVVPNATVGNNPAGTLATAYNATGCNLTATRALGLTPSAGDVPLRSAPYEHSQMNGSVSADYRLSQSNNLELGYEREGYRRPFRERDKTWEHKVRVAYVSRALPAGSLRVSFERGTRRGSGFIDAPLSDFYSSSLGATPVATGTNVASFFRNVDQFRRYDVADRDQNAFNVKFNHGLGAMFDASVGLQVKDLDYPNSAYGRNEKQKLVSPSFELNWQMSNTSSAYGYYAYQTGRQHQTGVQQGGCTIGNSYYFYSDGSVQNNNTGVAPAPPVGATLSATERVLATNYRTLCGSASATSPLFTTSRNWDTSQKERNGVGGFGLRHEMGRVIADVAYTHTKGRTGITYGYNAAALGLNATQVALAGNGFSDLRFDSNLAEASAVVPLVKRLSLRLLYRYERATINDWHYDGISVNPMPANNAAYLDFGPESYKVHFFGALFRYEL
jgi:hypothetical protein